MTNATLTPFIKDPVMRKKLNDEFNKPEKDPRRYRFLGFRTTGLIRSRNEIVTVCNSDAYAINNQGKYRKLFTTEGKIVSIISIN